MNERDTKLRVAIRARDRGGYMYQIFSLAGEPRTVWSDEKSYPSPEEAERAGYKAIAALNRSSVGKRSLVRR
jgi:hypothetical protein